MLKRFNILILFCIVCICGTAQMTFTLNGIAYEEVAERNSKGFTTITLPAGTNLSGLVTGIKVDGKTVAASQVKPNPMTTTWNYGELKVFVYNNKAYGFRIEEDVWFCGVFISDCHINQGSSHDGTSSEDMTRIMNNIIAMGKDGSKKVSFTTEGATNIVPKASIIFCLGDIDQDKGDDGSNGSHDNFLNATAEVAKAAGVPFIFIAGNHDLSPDYWTGDDPDYGVTSSGANADNKTISAIVDNNSYWNGTGVFDENIQYFEDNSKSVDFQSKPFTFKFKDVRFYCAHTYWFQKLYEGTFLKWGSSTLTKATYYAPDGVISALSSFVDNHADDASVWMQHFPWLAGSDCNRWWLDQNDKGLYIPTSDESAYGSNISDIAYNNATQANKLKKDPLSAIMMKAAGRTDGKVQHFSGHYHRFSDRTYTSTVNTNNKIHDYTVAAPGNTEQSNNAYIVLFKRGEGVKEVVQAQF